MYHTNTKRHFILQVFFKFFNVFISSTYLQIKFDNQSGRKGMFYPVSSVELILSSVDRNLVSGETKICNLSSNTTLIFHVSLVPKLGFET